MKIDINKLREEFDKSKLDVLVEDESIADGRVNKTLWVLEVDGKPVWTKNVDDDGDKPNVVLTETKIDMTRDEWTKKQNELNAK